MPSDEFVTHWIWKQSFIWNILFDTLRMCTTLILEYMCNLLGQNFAMWIMHICLWCVARATSPFLFAYFLTNHYATTVRRMWKALNHLIHQHIALMCWLHKSHRYSSSLLGSSWTAWLNSVGCMWRCWWISLGKAGSKGLVLMGWIDFLLALALRLKRDSIRNSSWRYCCFLGYWCFCLLQTMVTEETP